MGLIKSKDFSPGLICLSEHKKRQCLKLRNSAVPVMKQNSDILIYRTKDNEIRIETRLKDETVWLTQDQMAMLFGKAKSTINEHIKNIYAEEELEESQTLKKFGISEFQRKAPNYYNLDIVISVGYRVKSNQGTQFRQWATNGRLMKMNKSHNE